MRAIRDGKLYDTATAEKIFSCCRKVAGKEIAWLPGYCFMQTHDIDIYRTKSGAYFEHDVDAGGYSAYHRVRGNGYCPTVRRG